MRKGETLGDAIQRIVNEQNKRAQKNMELFRAAGGEAGKLMPYEYAKSLREQPRSSFRHEFGHHVHAAYGGSGRVSSVAPPEIGALISGARFSGFRGYGVGKDVLMEEKVAHDIAKHFSKTVLKKPYTKTQSWRARWAYGTYLGSSKGKGVAEVIMSR